MEIPFATSGRSSIGIEWELALVDPVSRALVPMGHELLAELARRRPDLAPRLSTELLLNTVELDTGVHTRVATAVDELRAIAAELSSCAAEAGVRVIGAGTHPFAKAADEPYTATERYTRLIDRTRWWGRSMLIYGIHVHVGIDRRDAVFPVLTGLLPYVGHLIGLTASSPFWEGVETGYASNRTMMFQQLPTAGLPQQFHSWEEYESFIQDLRATGVIDALTENRWDIRPAAHFGTIELRLNDAVSSLDEIGAVTALAQCLVDWLYAEVSAGRSPEELAPWQVRENKWRAARYGVDTELIVSRGNRQEGFAASLARIVETLLPTAERLGCVDELTDTTRIAAAGPSASRQLAVARASGLPGVVDALAEEFEASVLR